MDAPKTIAEQTLDWKTGWNGKLIVFSLLTGIFIILLALMFTFANISELSKNFPRYRCNPLFMPFVGSFGHDPKENFNFCLSNIFNVKAAEIFAPIYAILGNFTQIVQVIMNVALSIRQLFSNFLAGVNNFIRNVRDRVQGLLFSIRMSFLKMNNLMGKVYGTMYAVMWMGTSALTAGNNLANNDLVQFMFEFCFHPDTQIQRADGTYTHISNIKIGDELAAIDGNPKPIVSSVFRFDGTRTPMVQIGDVILSTSHYVQYNQSMIHAEDHPSAIPSSPTSSLVCLNVSGHRFAIGRNNIVVADYDEHDAEAVQRATQTTAMKALNGNARTEDYVADYSLGVDKDYEVKMADGAWRRIQNIGLGEDVWNAGKVLGIVSEQGSLSTSDIEGIRMAPAQIRFNPKTEQWERIAHTLGATAGATAAAKLQPATLYSLITERCGAIRVRLGASEHFIRDYREVPLPEMEDAYDEILAA